MNILFRSFYHHLHTETAYRNIIDLILLFIDHKKIPTYVIKCNIGLILNLYAYLHVQIEDGEIFATINQKDGMVSFHDNPEKYNNVAMLLMLDKEVRH